jgi:hypothetical protein
MVFILMVVVGCSAGSLTRQTHRKIGPGRKLHRKDPHKEELLGMEAVLGEDCPSRRS